MEMRKNTKEKKTIILIIVLAAIFGIAVLNTIINIKLIG